MRLQNMTSSSGGAGKESPSEEINSVQKPDKACNLNGTAVSKWVYFKLS